MPERSEETLEAELQTDVAMCRELQEAIDEVERLTDLRHAALARLSALVGRVGPADTPHRAVKL